MSRANENKPPLPIEWAEEYNRVDFDTVGKGEK